MILQLANVELSVQRSIGVSDTKHKATYFVPVVVYWYVSC